jgi:hypothetical protein
MQHITGAIKQIMKLLASLFAVCWSASIRPAALAHSRLIQGP